MICCFVISQLCTQFQKICYTMYNKENFYILLLLANNLIKKGCVIMSLPKSQLYTIDNIYNLPDGERAELIDGQIYYMAPPSRMHQRISTRLTSLIDQYIDEHQGSCQVYAAPFAVFFNDDSKNYVEPDISVICSPDKLTDRGCSGAPDWIIEIVSPSSRQMDYFTKLFKYRNSEVREYWIVDPNKQQILVYSFDQNAMEQYTFTDTIKVGIYEDLHIDFSKLL